MGASGNQALFGQLPQRRIAGGDRDTQAASMPLTRIIAASNSLCQAPIG